MRVIRTYPYAWPAPPPGADLEGWHRVAGVFRRPGWAEVFDHGGVGGATDVSGVVRPLPEGPRTLLGLPGVYLYSSTLRTATDAFVALGWVGKNFR